MGWCWGTMNSPEIQSPSETCLLEPFLLCVSKVIGHPNHHLKISSGWWFQWFFIFTPTWEHDPIWRAYFSNGLVQPPTSHHLVPKYTTDLLKKEWGRSADPPGHFRWDVWGGWDWRTWSSTNYFPQAWWNLQVQVGVIYIVYKSVSLWSNFGHSSIVCVLPRCPLAASFCRRMGSMWTTWHVRLVGEWVGELFTSEQWPKKWWNWWMFETEGV